MIKKSLTMKINPGAFPELTTERLLLRSLALTDASKLAKLRSDPEVNKYLDRPADCSLTDAENFVNKINGFVSEGKSFYWAISLKEDPSLIGTICYFNLIPEKAMIEIGYELLPEYQGNGYMYDALTEVLKFGFETVQLKTIVAMSHPDNERSAHALIKSGFSLDAENNVVSKEDADGLVVYVLRK